MKLVIATNNQNKLKEIQKILGQKFDEILTLGDLNINVEIEETGSTFLENALIKAKEICLLSKLPSLADDSGLSVDALRGAPGVYSARFAGIEHNDMSNNKLLLNVMKDELNRKANFTSCVVLYYPDGTYISAEGKAHGEIINEMRGSNGFGYDPVFFSYDLQKTFAEADSEEKNKVSHRGRALNNLLELLNMS